MEELLFEASIFKNVNVFSIENHLQPPTKKLSTSFFSFWATLLGVDFAIPIMCFSGHRHRKNKLKTHISQKPY